MNKEDKIQALVDDEIEYIRKCVEDYTFDDYLDQLFKVGHKGYENLTTKELNSAYKDMILNKQ